MANYDIPKGFELATPLKNSRWIAKGAAAIYKGDLVQQANDGLAGAAAAGNTQIVGVCLGYAKAADTEVLVSYDPDQLYVIQDDGSGTPAVSWIGTLMDIIDTAGVTTWGGTSLHELNAASLSTTDGQIRIVDVYPGADATSDFCKWIVVINEHSWAKKIGGI